MTPPLRLLVLVLVGLCAGCAVTNKDNRRLLNRLDSLVRPESTAARISLAPVGIPLGTATAVVDMTLVHPICVIPKAADDVYEIFWKPRKMDLLRKSLLFPLCVILTPPAFAGDWLLRSLFDLD